MAEQKKVKLGAGDILSTPMPNRPSKAALSKKAVTPKKSPVSTKNDKLLKLAEIGRKAHVIRKESNKNSYINIEQFFTERNIDRKFVEPFTVYMKMHHELYQHSLKDFDKCFHKYLHRFD